MKNKRKLLLMVPLIIALCVFLGLYYYFNKEDENSFTISENKWIKENLNTIIDFDILNDYPVYGENGIFRTITYQRAIINQLDTDKYIVVSLTDKNRFPIVRDMNSVLAEEHCEHFLDFRSYLLSDGLNDANITPTEEDTEAIDNGYIPPSFLKDETHGNGKFNDLLAEQLLEKMIDLGYLTQDQLNN